MSLTLFSLLNVNLYLYVCGCIFVRGEKFLLFWLLALSAIFCPHRRHNRLLWRHSAHFLTLVSVEERDIIFPPGVLSVFVWVCILEVSWRETASTTATMTTATTITRCYWDGGEFSVARSASGGVVACGSGEGQGIYVTTNESTIVARSCLLGMMRFLLLLLRQEEVGRHIPRTPVVWSIFSVESSRFRLIAPFLKWVHLFFFLGSPWLVLTSKQIIFH